MDANQTVAVMNATSGTISTVLDYGIMGAIFGVALVCIFLFYRIAHVSMTNLAEIAKDKK